MENAYLKIAEYSKKYKTVQNLMPKINKENLINQHKLQISKKASGIDKVNKTEYGKNLEQKIEKLLRKMKNFAYRPQPVKRVNIPKAGSQKLRPLGIPAYEDRLVQGVMANILNAIYEPKFKDFSYGFRPKRSCHNAIKALDTVIMTQKTRFVVDADIKGFFDNVNHKWLIKFLEHDIKDKNFIRYIKRFLKAGIMEQGKYIESDKGTPQGGLISPILANVYLHYVLDLWFEKEVTKKFNGESYMVRYADDFVCCFRYEDEANKFYKMLEERLRKFGLELSKDKTKIVHFGRFARRNERETKFDFLGFTLINGVSRTRKYIVMYRTSQKKLSSKMKAVKEWLGKNMHISKCELVKKLNIKLIGHYRYYGITGNLHKLEVFYRYITRELYKTLNKRSQRRMSWEKFNNFLKYNPIARPKIYFSL